MKLATIRDGGSTRAVRIDGDEAVDLEVADVRAVLERDGWQEWAGSVDGARRAVDALDYAPLIPRPDKVLCVGLNYRSHILETGSEVPTHPTLFSKFSSALIGANDDVIMPAESQKVDWEAELTIVIGKRGRRIPLERAAQHIAGYTIMNDVSVRDFRCVRHSGSRARRGSVSTPLGPWLVTERRVAGAEPRDHLRGRRRAEAEGRHGRPRLRPRRPRRLRVDRPHARARRRDRHGNAGRCRHALWHVPERRHGSGDRRRGPRGVPQRVPPRSRLMDYRVQHRH